MTALRPLDVEPLAEQRWAKIERSLFSRLERELHSAPPVKRLRSRQWALGAAAAATLLGAAGAAVWIVREPAVEVASDQPSRITTGASASFLSLPGLALNVEPQSAVVVGSETSRGLLIVLDRGSIACDVAPRSKDQPLVVQAGAARIRVVGTSFRVTRLGEAARVQVDEGVVEVAEAGRIWRVAAGEGWPPVDAEHPRESADLETERQAKLQGATAEPGDRAHVRAKRSDRTRRVPVEARPSSAEPERAEVAAEVPVEPSAQDQFEKAAGLERKDPARAAQLYRKLESGNDSWAANALYARARLEASRSNREEVKRLLNQYLARFPRGSNAEDARALLRQMR